MKKSILSLFLIFICLFVCVGCNESTSQVDVYQTNAFRIIRQADSDGKIVVSYTFPVNSALFENLGVTESEIKTYKFYLATYINALAQQNRDKAGDGVQVSGCLYFTDVDALGFSITFDSIDAQKEFFDVSDEDSSDSDTSISGFFVKKMEMTISFPISTTAAENLKLICSMAIQAWCANAERESEEFLEILESSNFIYDYASTSSSLKSEVMYDDDDFHHNVFIKSLAEIEENSTITFYVSYINTPIWYLSALVVVIAGMLIAYFVMKNRKQKSIVD